MSTTSIEQIRNLAAVAEEMIARGYPIFTIYADSNEMYVDYDEHMPPPCEVEFIKDSSGKYEHRCGTVGGVGITWLVAKQEAAA